MTFPFSSGRLKRGHAYNSMHQGASVSNTYPWSPSALVSTHEPRGRSPSPAQRPSSKHWPQNAGVGTDPIIPQVPNTRGTTRAGIRVPCQLVIANRTPCLLGKQLTSRFLFALPFPLRFLGQMRFVLQAPTAEGGPLGRTVNSGKGRCPAG